MYVSVAYEGVKVMSMLFSDLSWLEYNAVLIVFWANNCISGKYESF